MFSRSYIIILSLLIFFFLYDIIDIGVLENISKKFESLTPTFIYFLFYR